MASHPYKHQDKKMRSGTDVQASSAVVNRDIEGVKSLISQPTISSNFGGALSHRTNYTPSELFQQWKTSKLKEEANGQHLITDTSRDISQPKRLQDDLFPQKSDQHNIHTSRATNMQNSDKNLDLNLTKNPNKKLQRMANHQAVTTNQSSNETNLTYTAQMPFAQVLPIMKTHLDEDRAMQLQDLHDQLQANRISKSKFLREMRILAGPHTVKVSVYKAQQKQVLTPHGSSLPKSGRLDHETGVSVSSEDDTFEFMDLDSMPMNKPEPMFITRQLECQNMAVENFSLTSENNARTHPRKPPVNPKSKKQKVSGAFSDQSIQQLNDVTAVSGVNLREEEEQLFSSFKEETRVSEASRKIVQEEEGKLFLQKIPLQKKLAEIMAKYGVKHKSIDLERCLSLCVEERLRGFICNLVRHSKHRVDFEKPMHMTVVTSDVRQQIMLMNQKAQEELEKKQADAAEQLQKTDEVEKMGDDKIKTSAANVAARAAIGGDDVYSKWQLMAELARQKCDGDADSATTSELTQHPHTYTNSVAVSAISGPLKSSSKNQDLGKSGSLTHSISIKDVLSVLARENHMSRSTLTYRLLEKVHSNF
ncbi:uncharacterized protein [Rutidosis leptorrhynchoides]|uniref:uncharacterized protein isoform X2 n=1 Tax=Rutidosis leptorrhynchoides TaxID=125765 RepID=UPI003A9A252C